MRTGTKNGLLILLLLFSGCSERKRVKQYSIGKIISVHEVSTSFNDHTRLEITTENYYISIGYLISVPIGKEAFIIELDNGDKYFYWEGASLSYKIY